jgi:hypothetical protein
MGHIPQAFRDSLREPGFAPSSFNLALDLLSLVFVRNLAHQTCKREIYTHDLPFHVSALFAQLAEILSQLSDSLSRIEGHQVCFILYNTMVRQGGFLWPDMIVLLMVLTRSAHLCGGECIQSVRFC